MKPNLRLQASGRATHWRLDSNYNICEFSVEPLEPRTLLAVAVLAAGATGEESLSLEVAGQIVRTWNDVGGDYVNGEFQALMYNVDGINVNDIRLIFNNDGLSANGEDRNLRIDGIRVDGRLVSAEDPDVFTVGSWDPDTGCAGGYKQSEYIHCPGYMDFGDFDTRIIVAAAGATGEEQLQLQIDGVTVQTWDGVQGDYNEGVFEFFTYDSDTYVSADRVRVVFGNDGLSATGEDRNLRVDYVELDSKRFQSEDPSVESSGSWRPSDGCAIGFKQSEFLHCGDGYFQYSESSSSGSFIEVLADGDTNSEIIELIINGTVVATFDDLQSPLVYQANEDIVVSELQVAFVNDGTENGVDRNVRIDGVIVDGVKYETEDQTTYSEGSWRPSDGCDPGFKSSEYLHCNGFVQFQVENRSAGAISLETSIYSVSEGAGTVGVTLVRNDGSEGIVSIDYQTVANTAIDGGDFIGVSGRVIFQDGEISKVVSIDILDNAIEDGNKAFNFTIDSVGGGADLLVPRTATITIEDDESDGGLGGFTFVANTFDGTTGINLNGDAAFGNGILQLTNAQANRVGSGFYGQPIEFDANTSFQTNFAFRMFGGQGLGGADGLTFTVQNSPDEANALGGTGGGLGYGGMGPQSFAVEFDTFQNAFDVNDNSISILTAGDTQQPIVSSVSPLDLNDGSTKFAWISYDGVTNELSVFVSDTNNRPATPVLTHTIDLGAILGDRAYIGFTASTGGVSNRHEISQWSFESSSLLVPAPVDFSNVTIASGFTRPTAIDWSPDGRNMFIAEQRGLVYVMRDGVLQATPVLDFRDRVNGIRDRGLLDIAVHPDLAANPYLYLLYTYDPPEVNNYTGLAGPDGVGNRVGRLTRVELDANSDYTTIVPDSEVVILGTNSTWENFNAFANSTDDFDEPPAGFLPDGTNVQDFLAADSESHTVGDIEFGPDGALYVTNGDGASYNQVDPRAVRVQDIDNLSGKVLRIDPITGAGLPDNPFFNGDADANRSKVYQYGLRNPFRMTISDAGQVYIGDVGWTQWEEVNAAGPGANYGWPYYEGGSGGQSLEAGGYRFLPEAIAFYASGQSVDPPLVALSHPIDGINAIVVGDIYTGTAYPSNYQGDLLVNDLGQGIVRNVSFAADGSVEEITTFATGMNTVVQMRNGPDGFMYYVSLIGGAVGRWVPDVASSSLSEGSTVSNREIDSAEIVLPGVDMGARRLRIDTDSNAGPLVINLQERLIATDQGVMSIPEQIRRISARGQDAASALYVVTPTSNDFVRIDPRKMTLRGRGANLSAVGFDVIEVYSGGGEDTAKLTGGRGSDLFEAAPGQATLSSVGFTFSVFAFRDVTGVARKGGFDQALFHDSAGDDLLVASKNQLELSGSSFEHTAHGFAQTVAHSQGGFDRAIWNDRFASSTLMVGEQYGVLVGNAIAHELNGNWRLYVDSRDEQIHLTSQ